MNKHESLIEFYDHVDRCEECPHPDGCLRECVIEKYVHEDVAKIRGEEQE